MRILARGLCALALLAAGYVMGTTDSLSISGAFAQPPVDGPSDAAIEKIKAVDAALKAAAQVLEQENRNTSVITIVNPFAITVGGIDAQDDLAKGLGVDPVTFAALYSGKADSSVVDRLSYDSEGRLTYDGKVVRMYSIKRLKELFAQRALILGEEPK